MSCHDAPPCLPPVVPPAARSWYVIYRILRDPEHKRRTIIVAIHQTKEVFVIPPVGPLRRVSFDKIGNDSFNEFCGAEPLFIADSFLPPVLPMPTLVVSSPGRLASRDLSDALNNYSENWCYMPVPTEEELLEMNKVCFNGKDEAGVRHRMKLWGPIPRHVLVKTSPSEQKRIWATAASVSLDTLVAVATSFGDQLDAPHRLVHERAAGQDAAPDTLEADMNCFEYYARGKVVLASPSVTRYLAQRLVQEGKWNAKFLIDNSVGIGPLGALRGLKFEELVLTMLADGADFECRLLQEGGRRKAKQSAAARASPLSASSFSASTAAAGAASPSAAAAAAVAEEKEEEEEEGGEGGTRSVQSTPRFVWSNASELSSRSGIPSLLVPRVRNNAGLDALIWDPDAGHHWPLDCTVSEQHGVHAQGVSDAVRAFGWTPANGWPDHGPRKGAKLIKYFWVLPEDRFKDWWSPQAATGGSDSSSEAKEAFVKLRQYALCVTSEASMRQVEKVLGEQGVMLPIEMAGVSGRQRSSGNVAIAAAGRDVAK